MHALAQIVMAKAAAAAAAAAAMGSPLSRSVLRSRKEAPQRVQAAPRVHQHRSRCSSAPRGRGSASLPIVCSYVAAAFAHSPVILQEKM